MDENLFNDSKEAKIDYKNLKFGKVGDWFKGTLTDNTRQIKNNLSAKGEMQTIFEFKSHGGSIHEIENKVVKETPTVIPKDEFWSYITSKGPMLSQLKQAQLGQIIGLKFVEERASKTPGMNATKIIKVYIGDMDPEYQGETSQDRF